MARRNEEVARALTELADLMQLRGADRFRILAYRRAADAVSGLSGDVGKMSEAQLTKVRGVGKGVAARITEFVSTGTIAKLDELRAEIPGGVLQLTELPGLGPQRAVALYRELGVSSVDELRAAVEAGRVRELSGFGERSEQQLREALAAYTGPSQRVLLSQALTVAEAIVGHLQAHPAVVSCAYAGSLRRMRETIGDLDILVATEDPAAAAAAFTGLPYVGDVLAAGTTKTTVHTVHGLQVDLRTVRPDEFGSAMQYFTGSKEHNVKVRERAVRRGLKLSEYGLFDGDERLASATEEEVYAALGMVWIPPTMREDRGEVEAALAGSLPRLVEVGDLRGDLQSHSTYSDGRRSVRQMAEAAAERGYEYFAVTDHGPRLGFGNVLTQVQIAKQRKEIAEVNRALSGRITILHGIELNIGPDGSVDYPAEVLAGFDICVASLHSGLRDDRAKGTRRVLEAIANPHVHVIGHPTGRRLDRRPGVDLDIPVIARAAAEHGVALEINAYPERLDLRDEHIRWAREAGALFAISTDAHHPDHLEFMRYGVGQAQRGWVEPDMVVNTWPLDRLRGFLSRA